MGQVTEIAGKNNHGSQITGYKSRITGHENQGQVTSKFKERSLSEVEVPFLFGQITGYKLQEADYKFQHLQNHYVTSPDRCRKLR